MGTLEIYGITYTDGDIFIWRSRNKRNNPLEVGYLHYGDDDWYIGDEFAYPNPTGFDPLYVVGYGIKVGNLKDLDSLKTLW